MVSWSHITGSNVVLIWSILGIIWSLCLEFNSTITMVSWCQNFCQALSCESFLQLLLIISTNIMLITIKGITFFMILYFFCFFVTILFLTRYFIYIIIKVKLNILKKLFCANHWFLLYFPYILRWNTGALPWWNDIFIIYYIII